MQSDALMIGDESVLREVRVAFKLVQSGQDAAACQKCFDLAFAKVYLDQRYSRAWLVDDDKCWHQALTRDPDITHETRVHTRLHRLVSVDKRDVDALDLVGPTIGVVRGGVVHQPEIDVLKAELAERFFACREDVLRPVVGWVSQQGSPGPQVTRVLALLPSCTPEVHSAAITPDSQFHSLVVTHRSARGTPDRLIPSPRASSLP